jgi:hypothetical protein
MERERCDRAIKRGLGGGSVSGPARVDAAQLPAFCSGANVLEHAWQWRSQSPFESLECRDFTRKNLERPTPIDARFRSSSLGSAPRTSREKDESAVPLLMELQGMTVMLEVQLIGVEAMHDALACVSVAGFFCSTNDLWHGVPSLGRLESCDQRLDPAQDSSPASLFAIICFAA